VLTAQQFTVAYHVDGVGESVLDLNFCPTDSFSIHVLVKSWDRTSEWLVSEYHA
jgi:hypothetical protein